jgi:hypothetical protein
MITTLFVLTTGGDDDKYESRGRRDPFVPLMGMESSAFMRLEDVTSIADIRLEGIASGPRGKLVAMLNGEIVKEGDKFGEMKVKKITETTVTVIMDGKSFEKRLVDDGGFKNEK